MLTRLVAPVGEPVSLIDAKAHLRVDHTSDDVLIGAQLASARQTVEAHTGRALLTQTWEWQLDGAPTSNRVRLPVELLDPLGVTAPIAALTIPKAPLLAVLSVTYDDAAGVAQTMSPTSYVVQAPAGDTAPRGTLALAYGAAWPAARAARGSFRIRFTAGYGAAADVPAALKAAILLLLGELYESREASMQGQAIQLSPAVDRLLSPYLLFWSA
ncbi:head-tail connector protein [Elioraea sp.]|uniref:head-tail connector protein n=1 Tax=Elioraea sp. TaxID=2185103 RepID=UPI0025B9F5E5|nr:head-tail connector protein [Elioraea sp.]